MIAEITALGGAAWGVVLGVEIENVGGAGQLGRVENLVARHGQAEGRYCCHYVLRFDLIVVKNMGAYKHWLGWRIVVFPTRREVLVLIELGSHACVARML
ncbi:hypothetical protein GCM10007907_18070 [Chitinimonas prasina]|uniref:Uncharacterized protein n=1 Tax=Chitinimonas prasina TaxID=1434937 RepID=A0ABQ5YH69_9NEIS|nr:hypothetical protein GCM10007907_18070 [Chitinimonas prasina]